jgi:SAM-dependent methyltransferase
MPLHAVDAGWGSPSDIGWDPVSEFYTRHPYPPPVDNLDRARDEWRDEMRQRADYHLVWPGRPYRRDLDILVAGCGTWQAAKYALCRPEARVVGIDVSATSIEQTEKLKQKYGLTNLELRQLPLEAIGELENRFDLIVCTGVLHHLADPDAGLCALRSVLTPGGAIYLMVYAPYGRAGVYMLQEYCRRLGIGTSDQDIHDLVATLASLPRHHPLAAVLQGSRDTGNADAMADALLNPRDRSYSVPQLFALIEGAGLKLSRWYWQAPYLPRCGAISSTPHATRLAVLPEREQYAAMELWRGTMTCHSAILHRSDGSEADRAVSFDDERWLDFVPLRLPWTQLVRERLPRGAAGVLLNRSHPSHDLIVVVDAEDWRLFDGIDGHRSIAEIADYAHKTARGRTRRLFEKLWWYDQVVFDTSKHGDREGPRVK